MGRVWSCGFGLRSVTSGMEWDTTTGSPTIDTTTVRAGGVSLRCNVSAATAYVTHKLAAADTSPLYYRIYVRFTSFPGATIPILRATDNTPVDTASIRVTSGGALQLWDDAAGAQQGSNSSTLVTGQWYRVELEMKSANGGTAYLDGVSFASKATTWNNGQQINTIKFGAITSATMDMYVADAAVNDSSGSAQTSLPGSGAITYMWPDSAGDANDFATAVGGTAGQSNNYTRVQETPTPDDSTTYNETTATGTTLKDEFNCQTAASAGIGASDTITLVQVGARVGSDGTSTTRNYAGRIKSQASGTTTVGSTATCNVNGWTTHTAATAKVYGTTSYTDPQAGGAWTPTLLNSMQIGYGQVTSATLARRITTVWALVEFVPAAVTTSLIPVVNRRMRPLLIR